MPEQAPARSSLLFSRDALLRLIIPLVIEQLLLMTVGMADTVMVTTSGEAAVSGVSLVDNINTLIIQVFSALSTGGAVVVSQYLGRQDTDNAKAASKQLLYAMCALSLLLMGAALVLRQHILALIFGRVEADVMENALVYFLLTATAYPFMGIYNAGAALFRAMGNSKVSMFCSLVVNVINISSQCGADLRLRHGGRRRRYRHPGLPHRGGRHYHGAAQPPRPCAPGGGSAAF
ncbi:MAG: MATE family efflux transporter [Flavonifractor plautii]